MAWYKYVYSPANPRAEFEVDVPLGDDIEGRGRERTHSSITY